MKELSGTSRNYYLAEGDKTFIPMVELIFIVTEPQYYFEAGCMVKERKPETIRMYTNHNGLKSLLKTLMVCDKEFEAIENNPILSELNKKEQHESLPIQ